MIGARGYRPETHQCVVATAVVRIAAVLPSAVTRNCSSSYFINNTAATLEEVVEHYKQFFKRVAIVAPTAPLLTTQPGVVPPVQDRPFSDDEVPALLAYLRKI